MNVGSNRQLAGEYGGVVGSGVTPVTGDFRAIQCITACTFTAVSSNITGLANVVLPAGTIIQGVFTSLTGSATNVYIAYNRKY